MRMALTRRSILEVPHFYIWWWTGLISVSAVVFAHPLVPAAIPSPALALSLATLAAAIDFTILYLGVLRYRVLGRRSNLLGGLGFGALGVGNLLHWHYMPELGSPSAWQEAAPSWLYIALCVRGLAGLIFVAANTAPARRTVTGARGPFLIGASAGLGAALTMAVAAITVAGPRLPLGLGEEGRELLRTRMPVDTMLPGQGPGLLLANVAVTGLFLASAMGLTRRAQRTRDPHVSTLALTLSLLAVGQAHAVLVPPVAPAYVSIGDGFRLAAYLLLLCMLLWRAGYEVTERVAREERMRISRELHDGLAQHLGLLQLHLHRTAVPGHSSEKQREDLAAALRMVEAALLEARQAVLALRVGTVTWDQFLHAVGVFVDEFMQNHGVEVKLDVDGRAAVLDAGLQAEVLRILHESFSNAVRHGQATLIAARVRAVGSVLEVSVSDNGRGLGSDCPADGGFGLQSMCERVSARGGVLELSSVAGGGAVLRAEIPLPGGGGRSR